MELEQAKWYTLSTFEGNFKCRYIATTWNTFTGEVKLIFESEDDRRNEVDTDEVLKLEPWKSTHWTQDFD